ncbi:superoxide dismutase [Thecamonas trahens ATCC 50062]|uniref:Superoxide dismutase n=1 Tax=Thecamonas trahens ATCC 50062 TaxID=461836 RepID=A0A0L0DMD1_THETB|nr:superoxide dismutase [Thecamonas trahens ATCC 50062]KNC53479.1 superoxide dismutase [Thecamonas trahens ATCC 50062]|eukprot:XP_013761803.1 superoxide dismutase [Thecamonas trahens ATCC 50062]
MFSFATRAVTASAGRLAGAASATATLSALARAKSTYVLPDLPYEYSALEPVLSGEIMELHHSKHHQTYVNNLNAASEALDSAIANNDVSKQISLQSAIKFNGGGHLNHSLFWTNLAPTSEGGGAPPEGALAEAIDAQFGSLDAFITKFNATTAAVQGSGWGWLGYNKETKQLQIAQCANQDPLEATTGLVPLLAVDVWEHAYYLSYKNDRAAYLKNIWKIIDWHNVSERFALAKRA